MALVVRLVALLVLAGTVAPAAAAAAPPPNDVPATAGAFEPYTTRNGVPTERQAFAQLGEATPEPGIPACLGPGSFARTVWYLLPATAGAREISIEASGQTFAPVDLAVFVQPGPAGPPVAARPNACGGLGVGGADLSEEPVSAVVVRVPPGRSILLQVGRRGAQAPAEDPVELALSETFVAQAQPTGDRAGRGTPRIGKSGKALVAISGATTSEEDPATPACPSLGSVWRRVRPPKSGRWTVTATGADVGSLAVFAGALPTEQGFRDCVDRDGPGPLVLPVAARRARQLWIRVGTDRPRSGAKAGLRFRRSAGGDVASGGGCLASTRPSVAGRLAAGPAAARVRSRSRSIALVVRVSRGPVCNARLRVVGPKGRVYGSAAAVTLRGTRIVLVRRTRPLVPGRYRLKVDAAGLARRRIPIPSSVIFRLS
jgi:hypothetical protein